MNKPIFSDESRQALENLVQALRRERDELGVQVKLGKMELRDEWQEVELKWHAFEDKLEEANNDAKHALHEVGEEIAEIYDRLKRKLD